MNVVLCKPGAPGDPLMIVTDPANPHADLPKILTANAFPIDLPATHSILLELKNDPAEGVIIKNEEAIPPAIDFAAQGVVRLFGMQFNPSTYVPPKIPKLTPHNGYVSVVSDYYPTSSSTKFEAKVVMPPGFVTALYQESTKCFLVAYERSKGNYLQLSCEEGFNLGELSDKIDTFKSDFIYCPGTHNTLNSSMSTVIPKFPGMIRNDFRLKLVRAVEPVVTANKSIKVSLSDFSPLRSS
jgi:hypothetical protein